MTSRRQIFNCKAVEVTDVIEKVRVRRNKNTLDEIKKHSRTNPEIQSKEWNKKRPIVPDQQINCTKAAKKTKSQTLGNKK